MLGSASLLIVTMLECSDPLTGGCRTSNWARGAQAAGNQWRIGLREAGKSTDASSPGEEGFPIS